MTDAPRPDPPPEKPAPQEPYQRRPGGKALPSQEKAQLRKNRTERVRSKDWAQRFNAGDHDKLEEEGESESVTGKSDLVRQRVYVAPADQASANTADVRKSYVTRVNGLWAHVLDIEGDLPCAVRGKLKSFATTKRKVVVVGDRVSYRRLSPSEGVIEAVEPRTTVLARKDFRRNVEHIVAANIDQLVIVAAVRKPDLRPRLIDRYLVSAIKGKLDPLICFNKVDLDKDNDREEWVELYRDLGYRVISASSRTGEGIAELRAALTGRTSVVSGQSGVGKSSLLNAVQPGLNLKVGEVISENFKGRHTTTHVTLLPLTGGGAVVDTPGIRSFALWEVTTADLEACFVEFVDKVAGCKFADCTHGDEAGCAIAAAVEAGEISEDRWESYRTLYDDLSGAAIDPRE